MKLTFGRLPIWILLACFIVLPAGTSRSEEQSRDANAPGWLGVMVGGRDTAGDAPDGVPLTRIIADGPAARARLRARDRIIAIDGEPVSSSSELVRRVKDLDHGAWVRLTVRRGDDDEREINVRLGERPLRRNGFKVRRGWVGLPAIDLRPALRV